MRVSLRVGGVLLLDSSATAALARVRVSRAPTLGLCSLSSARWVERARVPLFKFSISFELD